MPTIEFKITEGKAPFFAEILEGGIPLVYCPTIGTWFFNDVECGVSYTIRVTDAENCTVEFQAECECTTTVEPTTTEAPTTTSEPTTTVIEELPCNYYDTEYFTPFVTQKNYTLGADTGVVELYFNFFDIPARIVIEFDEGNVIDTGYRGNPAYQTQLNTALTSLGEPPVVISNTREGRLYFDKETATESAVMYIYAPIGGAVVAYSLKCPADPVFTATFTNYVCEQEEYVPTTTIELTTTSEATTTEQPVTTEEVTTTGITTTEDITTTGEVTTTEAILNPSHLERSGINQPGPCGYPEEYPLSDNGLSLSPDLIVETFYLSTITLSDLDYIEITSLTIDEGLSVTYDSSSVSVSQIIYANGSQWVWADGPVEIIRQEEGGNDLQIVVKFKIKLFGYQISEEVTATLIFGGCDSPPTTTEEVTTTI